MACGSCGGKRHSTAYEVTLRDGTVVTKDASGTPLTMASARIVARADTTTGPRPSATVRAIPLKTV